MKKKKFWSLLLVLVMCLTLIPATAVPVAAEEAHTHCVCGVSDCDNQLHGVTPIYTEWTDELADSQNGEGSAAANSLPTTEGSYYLTKNVTLSDTWTVSANITLCLNGQTITGASDKDVIKVSGGATFNMSGGSIVGNAVSLNGSSSNTRVAYGAGVYKSGGGVFAVSGTVLISKNKTGATTKDAETGCYTDGKENNVQLYYEDPIKITNGLTQKARIGVSETIWAVFASNAEGSLNYGEIFTHDTNPDYVVAKDNENHLYFSTHAHIWKYTASADTITATCAVEGCSQAVNSGGSITIVAPTNLTYDGTEKTATLDNRLAEGVAASTIVYTKSGDEAFSGTPTEAGTYTASITLGTGDDAATASVTYTIVKKSSGKKHSNTGNGTVTDDDSNSATNNDTSISGNMGYAACGKDSSCLIDAFPDVINTEWYHDGVHYCVENGLMKGYEDGEFGINDEISRAQIVTMLWRKDGSPAASGGDFADVSSTAYYAQAVEWAASNGVVNGYSDELFGSNDSITREQLAAILYRYAKYKGMDVSVGEDTNILDFDDATSISSYAVSAIQWACGAGIMNGTETLKLSPQATATRAQAACMMQRFLTENK